MNINIGIYIDIYLFICFKNKIYWIKFSLRISDAIYWIKIKGWSNIVGSLLLVGI